MPLIVNVDISGAEERVFFERSNEIIQYNFREEKFVLEITIDDEETSTQVSRYLN